MEKINFKNKRHITKLWKDRLNEFYNFKVFFDSERVGENLEDDYNLSVWVAEQRILYFSGDLTIKEYDHLIENGFLFNVEEKNENEIFFEYLAILKRKKESLLVEKKFEYIKNEIEKIKRKLKNDLEFYNDEKEKNLFLEFCVKAKLIKKETIKERKKIYKWYQTYEYIKDLMLKKNERVVFKKFPKEYRWIEYNSRNINSLLKDQKEKFNVVFNLFKNNIIEEKNEIEEKKIAKDKALKENPTATKFEYKNCKICNNNMYNLKGECTKCVLIRDRKSKEKRKKEDTLKFNAKVASHTAKRKALKINATPKWISKKEEILIEKFYIIAQNKKKDENEEFHVDHIIPLVAKDYVLQDDGTYKYMHIACGLHCPNNMQVLNGIENKEKQSRFDRFSHDEHSHVLKSLKKYQKESKQNNV